MPGTIFWKQYYTILSTAFNVFAKTSVKLQKIPFEISTLGDPFYSELNMKNLMESIKQLVIMGCSFKASGNRAFTLRVSGQARVGGAVRANSKSMSTS